MSNYYEVTATLDDYDEVLFGSYILAEAKSELYEIKPSAKRDGYKNIRIEKLYYPADEEYVQVALKSIKKNGAFKLKPDAENVYTKDYYNRYDTNQYGDLRPSYTCTRIWEPNHELYLLPKRKVYVLTSQCNSNLKEHKNDK
tara:strand:+ start:833 stop:1258 length:426 start_codon:yes stop_codon:yes gene_type:complete